MAAQVHVPTALVLQTSIASEGVEPSRTPVDTIAEFAHTDAFDIGGNPTRVGVVRQADGAWHLVVMTERPETDTDSHRSKN